MTPKGTVAIKHISAEQLDTSYGNKCGKDNLAFLSRVGGGV
jgi:hypothetical protein